MESSNAAEPQRRGESRLRELLSLGLVVGLVRGLPRWVLGRDSYVTIHDNLDSDFLYRVLIGKPGRLFDYDGTIPEMLGGLPRWTFPSGTKLGSVVFHFFEPFVAYCILEQIVSLSAAYGMWLLLKDYASGPRWQRCAIACCFALLPYYVIYDLTVAGQALVLWAMLNAWNGRKAAASWAVCALFPFFSVLQMAGIFVVASAFIGLGAAGLWSRHSRPFWSLLWPLSCAATLGFGYLASDFAFISHYLRDDFVSHRAAFSQLESPGSFRFGEFWYLLVHGRYHAASQHEPIVVFTVVAVGLAIWRGKRRAATHVGLLALLSIPIAASQQYVRWPWAAVLAAHLPTLGQITPRFWWSFPVLWFLVLGLAAASWPRARLGQWVFGAFAVLQLYHGAFSDFGAWGRMSELSDNYVLLSARVFGRNVRKIPTYRQFRSQRAVHDIRKYVGEDPGHYLCLGFHPSVLQLEGLPTADGYRDLYPLSYKLRFRPLIEDELARNPDNTSYFDHYGSRAYYFYAGLKRNELSGKPFAHARSQEILMNQRAAHDLDIRWVVSAFEVAGPAAGFLTFHRKFSERGGFTFYLYRVQ